MASRTNSQQCQNPSSLRITDLPKELIASIPNYLHSLEELYSLLQTNRLIHRCCATTKAHLAPPSSKKHGQHLLPPHPYLLLAGTSRQVGDWAVKRPANQQRLWDVIKDGGVDGLASLAVEVARLSLSDIRTLHEYKYDIINPLSKSLDLKYGTGARDEISGSFYTICEDVERTLYNYLIYCNLFHLSIKDHYGDAQGRPKPLSPKMRWHWMEHCMPDGCYPDHKNPTPGACELLDLQTLIREEDFILALHRLLPGRGRLDGQRRWFMVVRVMGHQGFDTLRILKAGDVGPAEDLFRHVEERVGALPDGGVVTDPQYEEGADDGDVEGTISKPIGWFDMAYDMLTVVGTN